MHNFKKLNLPFSHKKGAFQYFIVLGKFFFEVRTENLLFELPKVYFSKESNILLQNLE